MDGTIEQIVGLTIAGNAAVKGILVDGFWPDSPIFQFCQRVQFVEPMAESGPPTGRVVAGDPLDWFFQLRAKTRGFRLHSETRNDPSRDRMLAGLAGGGPRWIIDTVGEDGIAESWEAQWQVVQPEPNDERIWSVAYWKLPERVLHVTPDRAISAVSRDLGEALEEIADFALRCGSQFRDVFAAAVDILNGRGNEASSRRLDPGGLLGPGARRLLAACQTAWVFGAMGSWNDAAYGGEFEAEGDRLSDRLFGLIQEALATATNSTCPPGG